jgi:hypothetical protein
MTPFGARFGESEIRITLEQRGANFGFKPHQQLAEKSSVVDLKFRNADAVNSQDLQIHHTGVSSCSRSAKGNLQWRAATV